MNENKDHVVFISVHFDYLGFMKAVEKFCKAAMLFFIVFSRMCFKFFERTSAPRNYTWAKVQLVDLTGPEKVKEMSCFYYYRWKALPIRRSFCGGRYGAVKPLIEKAFHGYYATVIAYGQTASEKTFTMGTDFDGNINDRIGLLPRAVEDVFAKIQAVPNHAVAVECSCVELYNEKFFDLLLTNSLPLKNPRRSE